MCVQTDIDVDNLCNFLRNDDVQPVSEKKLFWPIKMAQKTMKDAARRYHLR